MLVDFKQVTDLLLCKMEAEPCLACKRDKNKSKKKKRKPKQANKKIKLGGGSAHF